MHKRSVADFLLLALALGWPGAALLATDSSTSSDPFPSRYKLVQPARYLGMCDASGAVPLSSNLFAVACDEDNVLRVYRSETPGHPIKEVDCNAFLGVRGKSLEADLEAAARMGDRVFWIGSHGRNRNGKERQNRDRFFATDIKINGDDVDLIPVGRPYELLVDDLLADPRLSRFHLGEASRYAPKEWAALNIEGLSATPEGTLLIGFRNPVPEDKALLVPMLNPNDVVQGQRARLGDPIQLDLGGLGIRDIAWYGGNYLIIAGSYDGGRDFRVYRWKGGEAIPERIKVKHLNDYHPEAIVIYPEKGGGAVQILSDDGTLKIEGLPCKDQPPELQGFRSFWLVE
ncbi:MAG TPA: DUF3616 domain-containing protein [Verrucomicrobiae bacterium]|nr:DUF3616 domain-containing protein [Verrucomicrobiae bacterium]